MIVSDDGFAGESPPAAPPPPSRDSQCSPENPLLAAALAYAARGWEVIPCRRHGKTPLTSHGVKDATADPRAIRAWWTRWPDANVAIATGKTSGLVVLDVDGDEGLYALGEILSRQGGTVLTPTAATGGGGFHLFYAISGAGVARNSVRKLGPGLDVRGEGGYVVAFPSWHESGRRYVWTQWPHEWLLAPAPACPRLLGDQV